MDTSRRQSNRMGRQSYYRLGLACLALLSFCTGCASTREPWTWTYAPSPPSGRNHLLENSVTVLPFADYRPAESYNNRAACILALVFYATGVTYKPEAEYVEALKPLENLPRSLAEELGNRGMFSTVVYSTNADRSELILRGQLQMTRHEDVAYCYGLSFLSLYLYPFGLPVRGFTSTLSFSLELSEPLSQAVLWQHSYKLERRKKFNLYDLDKDGPPWEPDMLKELMPQILSDLETAIKGMTTASAEMADRR